MCEPASSRGRSGSSGETDFNVRDRTMNHSLSMLSSRDVRSAASSCWPTRVVLAVILVALPLIGCRDPLNVPDPNSVSAEDLESARAVESLVNGALKNMNEMIGFVAATYSTSSDEVQLIGAQEGWGALSDGFVDDPLNQFTDQQWSDVAEARYLADLSISQGQKFQSELPDQTDLVRGYLQGAVVYATIADVYDDFVIPDEPGDAAPPIGESNMSQLYDQAIEWLDAAENLARQLGEGELLARALAYRARVRHAKSVWEMLNPPGSTPSDPLVSNEAMAQDARAALSRIGTVTDWSWEAVFSRTTTGINELAQTMNDRGDLQFGPSLVRTGNPQTIIEAIVIEDPVTGEPSPVARRKINAFRAGGRFSPVNIVTAREMHLLLAEHLLAQGDSEGFRDYINNVRSIAGQPPFEGQVPDLEMLIHTRQVNLLIMNRRLHDLYRFGLKSGQWVPRAPAFKSPGTFFPIAIQEIRNNPNVSGE